MGKYLAGISGGPDSVALLYKYRRCIKAVCCVNYHVRADSDKDVQIVQQLCDQYHIPCFVKDVYPTDHEQADQNNFEAWARQVRYDFFVQTAHRLNLKQVLIAHNFNDWLETAYMSLTRKSKALYYGIQSQSYYQDLLVKRPLLRFKKSTLQRFDDEHHLPYAIDCTNFCSDYERNRVRKLIHSWNSEELYQFKKKVDTYNKIHHKMWIKVDKLFKKWIKSEFKVDNLRVIHQSYPQFTYYLLYKYLRMFGVKNVNYQKVINIQEFVLANNHPDVSYRLGDNYNLYKIKKFNQWYLAIGRNGDAK